MFLVLEVRAFPGFFIFLLSKTSIFLLIPIQYVECYVFQFNVSAVSHNIFSRLHAMQKCHQVIMRSHLKSVRVCFMIFKWT